MGNCTATQQEPMPLILLNRKLGRLSCLCSKKNPKLNNPALEDLENDLQPLPL